MKEKCNGKWLIYRYRGEHQQPIEYIEVDGVKYYKGNTPFQMFPPTFNRLLLAVEDILWQYYFDNPLPEDDTDDVDLLESRTDDRLKFMSDIEVLEEIVKLYKEGKLK